MKMDDAVIVWTPGTSECRMERHHSTWVRSPGDRWMPVIQLGEWGENRAKSPETKLLAMFLLFNTIVVRDRVPVEYAHKAFLGIDEYRKTISPDAPGAD